MTTYRTGNAIGSADPRDLYDNAENLDEFVNSPDKLTHPDRLGVPRKTWHGMEQEFDADQARREGEFQAAQADKQQRFNALLAASGYVFVGDYAAGVTVNEYNEVIRDDAGNLWRAGSTTELPYTTDGAGMPEGGAFVSAGDAVLRNDLMGEPVNGQGAQLVRGSVIYVNSIADLQALPTSELVDGQQVQVKEYHAGTGVGGGEFYWDATSTEEDNGGTVFSVNGVAAGRWVRLTSGPLNVTWFGASPEQINNTPAIQAALDYSESSSIGHVYIPGGEYMVDAHSKTEGHERRRYGLDVRQNTLIEMSENTTLRVIPNDKESYSVFRIEGVSNVSILGGNITGEKLEHTYAGSMEWGHGITIQGDSKNITISGVTIKDCMGDGISIRHNTYGDNNITIKDCTIFDCRRHELTIASGDKISVSGCSFYKTSSVRDGVTNVTYGGLNVDIEPDGNDYYPPANIIFDNCTFDCPTNACLRCDTKLNAVKGLTVSKCIFTSYTAALIEAISVVNGQYVLFEGNRILGNGSGEAISINSVKNVVVKNNYCDSYRGISVGRHVNYEEGDSRWVTEYSEDVLVSDNIVNSLFRGIIIEVIKGVVHDNIFNHSHNIQQAVRIGGGCRDVTFSGNTITNPIGRCFFLEAGIERVNVTGNRFETHGARCGDISASKDVYISNNTFITNQSHIRVTDNQDNLTLSGNAFIVLDGETVPYGVLHLNGSGDVFLIGNNFSQLSSSEYSLSSDISTNLVRGGNILADGSYEV